MGEESSAKPGQQIAKNVTAVANGSCEGTVKSFVDQKGYGFIDYEGQDVFLHINDCMDGRPQQGDHVSFDIEETELKPGQRTARRVVGCSRPLLPEDEKGKGKG